MQDIQSLTLTTLRQLIHIFLRHIFFYIYKEKQKVAHKYNKNFS